MVLEGGPRPDERGAVATATVRHGMLQAAGRGLLWTVAAFHGEPGSGKNALRAPVVGCGQGMLIRKGIFIAEGRKPVRLVVLGP